MHNSQLNLTLLFVKLKNKTNELFSSFSLRFAEYPQYSTTWNFSSLISIPSVWICLFLSASTVGLQLKIQTWDLPLLYAWWRKNVVKTSDAYFFQPNGGHIFSCKNNKWAKWNEWIGDEGQRRSTISMRKLFFVSQTSPKWRRQLKA